MHFRRPGMYRAIVPPYLPAPTALVYLSGMAELGGGLALMSVRTREPGRWWLAATLLAVFPANLHMAAHPERYPRIPGGARTLRLRLPLQALLIAWVLRAGAPADGC